MPTATYGLEKLAPSGNSGRCRCRPMALASRRAGDVLTASRAGYAGVTSQHAASGSPARAEMALNQDKSRLQLRRYGSPGKERSFKFSDCVVSENSPTNAYSPRSAAIVPGFSRAASPLRGLKAGELMSAVREERGERSPQSDAGEDLHLAMAWPFQRGDDLARAPPFGARSISPFRSRRDSRFSVNSGSCGEDRQNLAVLAATAAASAEEEAEVDVLRLGGVGRDGHTRPLSPRVRDSHWLDGLSPRIAERGGSRLFPTHLAMPKDRPSPSTGAAKAGGAYMSPRPRPQCSPRAQAQAQVELTKKKPDTKAKAAPSHQKAVKKPELPAPKMQKPRADPGLADSSPQLPAWAKPLETPELEGTESRSSTKDSGISKFHALRQRLETRLKAAEQGLQPQRLPNASLLEAQA